MKKQTTIMLFICAMAGILLGSVLLIYGFKLEVPSAIMQFGEVPEYVGGDAYNYIMEASLRGGENAAATISRAIYICVGSVLALISTAGAAFVLVKLSKEEAAK